jgi:hypothetical protein
MSNLSLEKSIRTCKVETGWADRIQSDRFLNPSQMVCIPWNGMNNKGQSVCPDSWYTKTPGCNSAEDRVVVENDQRPQYIDYVTLNAAGIKGHIYGNEMQHDYVLAHDEDMEQNNNITGNYGLQWGANTRSAGSCAVGGYEKGMAQVAANDRKAQSLQQNYEGYSNTRYSGF